MSNIDQTSGGFRSILGIIVATSAEKPNTKQVPLASIICTHELDRRPARQPDPDALNVALVLLAQTLANSPEQILQQLGETALELCHAGSAGISLLEEENGRKIFRWHGLAGQYAPHLMGTTPREFSPCGTVVDTDQVQLMTHLDRHFTYFAQVQPRISEALLVPFHSNGKAVGTIWIVSHEDHARQFDAEDARVMKTLGKFAEAAHQAISGTLALKSIFAAVREPLLVLDRNLRVHTASQSFFKAFHLTPSVTEGRFLYKLGSGEWDIPALRNLLEEVVVSNKPFEDFAVTKEFASVGRRVMLLNARKLWREEKPTPFILLAIEDITGRPHELQERVEPEPVSANLTNRFDEIIGSGAALRRVLAHVDVVAPTNATVLITGETGTGKELVARAIHRLSPRKNLPFISLNCAAIPTGLLESELFGYERGAFTGALGQKIGRFEMANHGTLFLDEVGDIPVDLQPKLLRALEEKSFERLGGTRTIPIDVRLVAATNRNLTRMMGDKVFRSDLYYRLMVFPIVTPALRDHADDIPALVRHFTRKYATKMNRRIDKIPSETMEALVKWNWPGNVRELENFIERSVILSRGSVLCAPVAELQGVISGVGASDSLEDVEREHILRIYRETGGVVSMAATRLGIPRTTLNARMKKLGISRSNL